MFLISRWGAIALFLTISPVLILSPPMVHAQSAANSSKNLEEQANQLEREDRYAEAEAIYRQILALPETNVYKYNKDFIRMQLGKMLQAQGKFSEAIAVFQQVTTSTQPSLQASAYHALGDLITHRENSVTAAGHGLYLIRQNPADEEGYCFLATGLAAQGQLVNGLTILESYSLLSLESGRLLAKAADCDKVVGFNSGSGYRTRSSIRQDGIELYRQLIRRYPQNARARAELLEILNDYGKPAEAIAAYRAEILRQPNNEQLYWILGDQLQRNNQADEAITVYEQLIAKGMVQPRLYQRLGSMFSGKQPDRAIRYYLKGIKAFPGDFPSDPRMHVVKYTNYDALVETLARQNRLDRLLPLVEGFIPNPSKEIYGGLVLALCYQGYPAQAKIVRQRVRERYPGTVIEAECQELYKPIRR
jgi:tetratricopeptide (TPR) repeat protein